MHGCSSDAAPIPDKVSPVKDGAIDHTRDLSFDRLRDTSVADSPARDTYAAQFLSSTHPGWKRTDCLTCHPYSTADKPPLYKCATCHGGNGACNPNGGNSTKKDHTEAGACTTAGCHTATKVHPNKGTADTYTQDVQCVTCHFAKRGGTPDC
jgi:hypothetical protein